MVTNGTQNWEDIGNDAIRQVKNVLSSIDLDGIADSVGKAVGDAARQLGIVPSDPSPYIIYEPGSDRRAVLNQVGGAILLLLAAGGAATCIGCLFVSPFFTAGLPAAVFSGAVAAVLGVPGVRSLRKGRNQKRVNEVLKRVARRIGDRERVSVNELVKLTKTPEQELEPALRAGIQQGLIPQGRLEGSGAGETLFLTAHAWEVATDRHGNGSAGSRRNVSARTPRTSRATESGQSTGTEPGVDLEGLPEDAVETLKACVAFVSDIRAAQSGIDDDQVSSSLAGIASKVESLTVYVYRHPETASQLKKMTSYYFPTTVKLAQSYAELESRATGAQAESTMAELKETLALVDDALAKLSDSLVQEQSWDLKSDMDVMRQMLEQDGLS